MAFQLRTLCLTVFALALMGCSNTHYTDTQKDSIKPQSYFYPYLSSSQISTLDYYNIVGIMPESVIVPARQDAAMESVLNANNLIQMDSVHGMTIFNKFLAYEAKEKLGCKEILKNKKFIVQAGIYHFDRHTISVAAPLKWQLTRGVTNLCTPNNISGRHQVVFNNNSPYWSLELSSAEGMNS